VVGWAVEPTKQKGFTDRTSSRMDLDHGRGLINHGGVDVSHLEFSM